MEITAAVLATRGNGFRISLRFRCTPILPVIATGCHRSAPQVLHPPVSRRISRSGDIPRLTVEEGRIGLHGYVKEFRGLKRPADSLLDRAVEVGPRRQGGLLLVPAIDALA